MHGSYEREDALIKRAGSFLDMRGGKPALAIYFHTGGELLDESRLWTSPFFNHTQRKIYFLALQFLFQFRSHSLSLDGSRNLKVSTLYVLVMVAYSTDTSHVKGILSVQTGTFALSYIRIKKQISFKKLILRRRLMQEAHLNLRQVLLPRCHYEPQFPHSQSYRQI